MCNARFFVGCVYFGISPLPKLSEGVLNGQMKRLDTTHHVAIVKLVFLVFSYDGVSNLVTEQQQGKENECTVLVEIKRNIRAT
jgi:hypothetical protein